jgi:hypothetical protein
MRKILLFMPLALAGCATQAGVPVSIDQVPPGSTCTQSSVLDSFVGQPATAEVGARLLAASRASTLRWVAKGMAVTMDYRADRLTVWLDSNNRIERVTCG